MRPRFFAAALLAASTLFGATQLHAAPTAKERAEAKTLWTKGKKLVAQEKWVEAIEAFRAASELAPTAQYQLDLARALAEAKELLEAKQMAELVVRSSEPNTQLAKNAAKKLADSLAPRIPTLEIAVRGDAAATATVTLNGDEVQAGSPLALDPGSYLVRAVAGDGGEAKSKVELVEGEHRKVELVLEAATTSTGVSNAPSEPSSGGTMLPAAIAFGVGGAGVVLGSVFGILGFHETAAVTEVCGGTVCPPDRAGDVDRVQMYGTVSNVSFAVGGLGIATGIVLALTMGADDAPDEASAWVQPYVGAGEVGVVGRF
jgi:hypothetical protein